MFSGGFRKLGKSDIPSSFPLNKLNFEFSLQIIMVKIITGLQIIWEFEISMFGFAETHLYLGLSLIGWHAPLEVLYITQFRVAHLPRSVKFAVVWVHFKKQKIRIIFASAHGMH